MLSASHISVAQYNIFLLWKTLLYILFKKLSDIAVPLLWNRKVKMCSVQWCNYSQYYEETWSLSFVSNRDARPVALFVCPSLVCLRQDRALPFAFALQNTLQNSVTVLHLQDMHKITLISPPPLFVFVQARMRRNIPESDSEATVQKLLKILQSSEAIRDAQALLLQAHKHAASAL